MTVKELKEALHSLPDDMPIILQKDSEGNGFSPLHGADPDNVYIPNTKWGGYVYCTKWTAEEADMSQEEWEETLKLPQVLILYPVN